MFDSFKRRARAPAPRGAARARRPSTAGGVPGRSSPGPARREAVSAAVQAQPPGPGRAGRAPAQVKEMELGRLLLAEPGHRAHGMAKSLADLDLSGPFA